MIILAGVDIGGTKCSVSIGELTAIDGNTSIEVISKRSFATPSSPKAAIDGLLDKLDQLLHELGDKALKLQAIGISCGGPLDSRRGLILSPPNLLHWDQVDIVTPFHTKFHIPVGLQNDANACALAEWKWGAGKGCSNMIFLTFGTGMGAGLILDGRLYSGTNDNAGEVGHVRLEHDGPIGYGKNGSFEGFCSGGGIARLAVQMAEKRLVEENPSSFCSTKADLIKITAQSVGAAAQEGDMFALEVLHVVARKLGQGLAMLIDILNPEKIVIGSIYARQLAILEPIVLQTVREEALGLSLQVCQIVSAGLGESVGDLASLSVALNTIEL